MWFRGDILFCYDLYNDLKRIRALEESEENKATGRTIKEEIEHVQHMVQLEMEINILKQYINKQFYIDLPGMEETTKNVYKKITPKALIEETKNMLRACDCELVREITALEIKVDEKNYNLIDYLEEWYSVLSEWKWALYKRYQLKCKTNEMKFITDEYLPFTLLSLLDTSKAEDKQNITWLEKITSEETSSKLSKYNLNKIRKFIDFYPQEHEFRLILLDDLLGISFDRTYRKLTNYPRWQVHSQNLKRAKRKGFEEECKKAEKLFNTFINLLRRCPIFIGHLVLEGIIEDHILWIECPNHPSKENMDKYINNLELAIRFFQIILIRYTVDLDEYVIKTFPKSVTDDFIVDREYQYSKLMESILKTSSIRSSLLESLKFDNPICRESVTHREIKFFEKELFALKGNKEVGLAIIKYWYTKAMLESGRKCLNVYSKKGIDDEDYDIRTRVENRLRNYQATIETELEDFALETIKEALGETVILSNFVVAYIVAIVDQRIGTIIADDVFINQLTKKIFRTFRRNGIGPQEEEWNYDSSFWTELLPEDEFEIVFNQIQDNTIIPMTFEDWIEFELPLDQIGAFRRILTPMIQSSWELMVGLKEKSPRKVPFRPIDKGDGNVFLDIKHAMMAMDWVETNQ